MLSSHAIKRWYVVHKWTSLICTLFLLMLCLTGLPLIFHEEIEHALGESVEPPVLAVGTPRATLDQVVEAGLAKYPGKVMQFFYWDPDGAPKVLLGIGDSPSSPPDQGKLLYMDSRTAQVLQERKEGGYIDTMLKLHVEMFAGIPGKLFLGIMGGLFVLSLVSGTVLYAPFMRKLDFGTVRRERSARLKWLDLHNLLGIATLCWALVVGGTGVLNTWADLVIKLWQFDQLGQMVAPYKGKPLPAKLTSLDAAVAAAKQATPGMEPSFVAYPGSLLSSRHHYGVFMRGSTPVTKRLLKPALIDAETAKLTDSRDLPWYVTALLISQPLHFGDYGGLPMKVLWGVLDLITMVVLGSGVYLWIARRKVPVETRLAELFRRTETLEPATAREGALA